MNNFFALKTTKIKYIKNLTILICLLFSSSLIFAQNSDDDEDDVIVVSAAKIEQTLDDAVEKVLVISEKDIEESGAKTLSEAVKEIPGIVVTGPSAANPTESISMQGFDSSYVKILVDGIAVTGDIGGSTAVFEIPVEMIDHIEIVQGASSALYGSDAMGGIINIITKQAKNDEGDFNFSGNIAEEFSFMKSTNWRNYTSATALLSWEHLSSTLTGSFDYTPGKTNQTYYALAGGNITYYKTPYKMLGYGRGTINWKDTWGNVGLYSLYASSLQKSLSCCCLLHCLCRLPH